MKTSFLARAPCLETLTLTLTLTLTTLTLVVVVLETTRPLDSPTYDVDWATGVAAGRRAAGVMRRL